MANGRDATEQINTITSKEEQGDTAKGDYFTEVIDKEDSNKAKVSVVSDMALHNTGTRKGTKATQCMLRPPRAGSLQDAGTLHMPAVLQTCKTA